jgi:putative SOS response-associated peptidase YedK
MCGRFTLKTPVETLAEVFELPTAPELPPRFNIAPSEAVAAVRVAGAEPLRELALLRWGLVPPWADVPKVGSRMINARAETVATNGAFRAAFRRRRCLVPADGFYEWQRQERAKQPFYIHMRDDAPFAFAGLWEVWEGKDGTVLETCTVITTEPNELMQPIHNRMPVILDRADYARWLDPRMNDPESLKAFLRPYPPEKMAAYPVSRLVNSPSNDAPECLAPLPA